MNCCFDDLNFSLLVPSGKGRSEKNLHELVLVQPTDDKVKTSSEHIDGQLIPFYGHLRIEALLPMTSQNLLWGRPIMICYLASGQRLPAAEDAWQRGGHSPSPNTAKCYLQPGKTLRRWFCLLISCFKLSISSLSAFASSVSPWVLVSASLYLYWMYWSGEILTKLRSLQCLA